MRPPSLFERALTTPVSTHNLPTSHRLGVNLQLLEGNDAVRRKYEGLWTHVHVDEFQVMTVMTPPF